MNFKIQGKKRYAVANCSNEELSGSNPWAGSFFALKYGSEFLFTDYENYEFTVEAEFEIEKPWFAPTDIFIQTVRDKVEEYAAKAEEYLITDLAQHI